MPFFSYIGQKIIEDLLSSILVDEMKSKKVAIVKFLVKPLLTSKKKYFLQLNHVLRDMPFIYKDYSSEVLADFQEVDLRIIELNEKVHLVEEKENPTGNRRVENMLSLVKKSVIFGNAGIGKSTFVRYITLCLINNKKNIYGVHNSIPIFIQLKSISNIEKSPIVRHLASEIPLFKGMNVDSIVKHIKTNRYLIILDGYDEIASSERDSYIKREIGVLFGDQAKPSTFDFTYIDSNLIPIYSEINDSCRIWLTTREEFYSLNPILQTKMRNSLHTNGALVGHRWGMNGALIKY